MDDEHNEHDCPRCGKRMTFAPENYEYDLTSFIYWCQGCWLFFEDMDLVHHEAVQAGWAAVLAIAAGQQKLPGFEAIR